MVAERDEVYLARIKSSVVCVYNLPTTVNINLAKDQLIFHYDINELC
jgi:hypothetical protein